MAEEQDNPLTRVDERVRARVRVTRRYRLVTVIPLVGTPNAPMAVMTATTTYLGGGAAFFVRLGPVLTRVLTMSVVLISSRYPNPVAARSALVAGVRPAREAH